MSTHGTALMPLGSYFTQKDIRKPSQRMTCRFIYRPTPSAHHHRDGVRSKPGDSPKPYFLQLRPYKMVDITSNLSSATLS